MPHFAQKRCLITCLLKVYVLAADSGVLSRNAVLGTNQRSDALREQIRSLYPLLAVVTCSDPFQALTILKAERSEDGSGFYAACIGSGEADYRPESKLPAHLNLDWWTFPTVCRLTPGKYFVQTAWHFNALLFTREIRADSNIFTVRLPP